jgi:magnesium transporter
VFIATPDPALRRNLTQESLEKCLADGCTMWIDIVTPEANEIGWLEGLLQLSPNVVEDLLREDRRPTLLVYPTYLFLSLFQPSLQADTIVGKEIHCLLGEHFFITVRQADTTAIEVAYDRVAQNIDTWQRGIAYFLYLTAQHVIDTYYPLVDRISNQLNQLEEKLLSDDGDKQAQRTVYRVKQHLIGLRQMIAPQREVLSNLTGEKRLSQNDDIRDLFRHLYDRLLGIYDVIDTQRDLTGNVLDIIANQQSRKMGDAINRLTVISMVFLPFTFFLGLFDSNFFTIGSSVHLPINGLAMFLFIVVTMSASIAGTLMVFRWRSWV